MNATDSVCCLGGPGRPTATRHAEHTLSLVRDVEHVLPKLQQVELACSVLARSPLALLQLYSYHALRRNISRRPEPRLSAAV